PYRFYQANLLKIPYLKISSPEWGLRTGTATSASELVCVQPIQVFSNLASVTHRLNNRSLGTRKPANGIARFEVPFVNGLNRLQATAAGAQVSDQADINFQLLPHNLRDKRLPFTSLNVSLGDRRYCYDQTNHELWLPEQE